MKTFILALGLAAYAGSSFALPQHTDAIAQAPLVLQPPSDDRIPLALSSSSDVLSPELDSLIEQVWEDWKIPGVGVAVVRRSEYPLSEGGKVQDGWKVEVKGYGWANVIDGTKIDKHSRCKSPFASPGHVQTLFADPRAFWLPAVAIASNSKQFTALVAGMVVTNASLPELSWETKMRDLVPGWGLKDEWADKEATLVDTLSTYSFSTSPLRETNKRERSHYFIQVIGLACLDTILSEVVRTSPP
jgi:CubicO group peptidase (beta-lactamase class C family)